MEKLITLENGLRIVLVQKLDVRSVSLGIYVQTGSAYETPEINGAAHFIEHMQFKGTEKRSAFDIANDIDKVGAQINAYTAKNNTCFYTVSLDENVETCFDVLSDMYFNSKYDPVEFDRERKVVIEEINESEDDPSDVCFEHMTNLMYKGTSFGKPILGTRETLNAFTPETLMNFKKKYYNAHNTVISIVGNITEDRAVELVKKYFNFGDTSKDVKNVPIDAPTFTSGIDIVKKDIEQVHIGMSFPGFPMSSRENMALTLFTFLFGGNMSSRLFQSIREKLGLCYSIYASQNTYLKSGYFYIYTSTNQQKYDKAIKQIVEEIKKVKENGITEDELETAKNGVKTALVLGNESTSGLMRVYGRQMVLRNELYDTDVRIKLADEITREYVNEIIKKVFDFSKMNMSIVGKNVDFDINSIK